MNCLRCNKPVREVFKTAAVTIDGRRWVIEYREWECAKHPDCNFQDEKQLTDNLAAIQRAKDAAKKLAKHQTI